MGRRPGGGTPARGAPQARPRCPTGSACGESVSEGCWQPPLPTHLPPAPGPRVRGLAARRRGARPATGPPPLTPAGPPEAGVRAQRLELAAVGALCTVLHLPGAAFQPPGVDDVPEVGADGGRQQHEAQRPGQRRHPRQRRQGHPHGPAPGRCPRRPAGVWNPGPGPRSFPQSLAPPLRVSPAPSDHTPTSPSAPSLPCPHFFPRPFSLNPHLTLQEPPDVFHSLPCPPFPPPPSFLSLHSSSTPPSLPCVRSPLSPALPQLLLPTPWCTPSFSVWGVWAV